MSLINDSELFVQHATWLGPHLAEPTIGAFACWLAPWLRDASKRSLEALYRIDHPTQRAAEVELIKLLKDAPRSLEHQVRLDDHSGRHTDWPSTLAYSHPFAPARFANHWRTPELDRGLLAGLATIGRQWSHLLTEYGGHTREHKRVVELHEATRRFGRGRLTLAHLRRLARLPQAQTRLQALRDALALMNQPLTTPQSLAALEGLAVRLTKAGRELQNQNDALEVSVILSIARAAQRLGWKLISARADSVRPKPRLELANGPLRCAITKGRFEYPAEPARRAVDALSMLQSTELGLVSRPGQPDVVISFWRTDAPEDVLFCIADAKRNESGDGIAYLKDAVSSMTGYMVSYSEPLRAHLSAEAGGFRAALMPAATLFLQQAACGRVDESPDQARKRQRERAWLATLDARHYAVFDEGVWQDSHVCAWFQELWECAAKAMRPRGGARRTA